MCHLYRMLHPILAVHRCGNEAGVKSRCKPHNDGAFVLCDELSQPLARASSLEALSLLLGLRPGQVKLYPRNTYQPGKSPEELTGQHPDAKGWSPSNLNGTAAKVPWGYSGGTGAVPVAEGGRGAGEGAAGAGGRGGGSVGVLLDPMGRAGAGAGSSSSGVYGYESPGHTPAGYTPWGFPGGASSSGSGGSAKQRALGLPPSATAASLASPGGSSSYTGSDVFADVAAVGGQARTARQLSPNTTRSGDSTSYTGSDWGSSTFSLFKAPSPAAAGDDEVSSGKGKSLARRGGFGMGSPGGNVQRDFGGFGSSAPLINPWPPP
jgi:hypothetical protein